MYFFLHWFHEHAAGAIEQRLLVMCTLEHPVLYLCSAVLKRGPRRHAYFHQMILYVLAADSLHLVVKIKYKRNWWRSNEKCFGVMLFPQELKPWDLVEFTWRKLACKGFAASSLYLDRYRKNSSFEFIGLRGV